MGCQGATVPEERTASLHKLQGGVMKIVLWIAGILLLVLGLV
jgi:hypothetical protein